MKRLISILITAAIVSSCIVPMGAAADGKALSDGLIVLNDSFEDIKTGGTWDSVTVSGAETRVVEREGGGKAVMLIPAKCPVYIRKSDVKFDSDCVISFELPEVQKDLEFAVGISASGKAMKKLVSIKNNSLAAYDGTAVKSGLDRGNGAKIALVLHGTRYFDIYVNGGCVLSGKKMPSVTFTEGDVVFFRRQAEGTLCMDNVKIYYSDDINAALPKKAYNSDSADVVNAQNDNGDYLYFDSTNLDNSTGKYVNYAESAGGNIIKCERFDYMNPEREHSWIYMEKRFFTDCFFTATMRRGASARDNTRKTSTRQYSYYLFETDFKIDEFSRQISLPQIRDSISDTREGSQSPMIVGDGGSIQFSDGSVIGGIIKKGEWYSQKIYFDYIANTLDIYIDGEKIKTLPIAESLRFPEKFRVLISALSDKGKIYVDNMKFTGLVEPMDGLNENRTDIFTDETAEREFMKGKIGFNVNSSIMYADDEKTVLGKKPIFADDELFVDAESFNAAFHTDFALSGGVLTDGGKEVAPKKGIKTADGTAYLPVMELGHDYCGKQLFYHDKSGIILFGDEPINLDVSDWDYKSSMQLDKFTVLNDIDFLSNLLTFERPSGETLEAAAEKQLGDLSVHPRLIMNDDRIARMKRLIQTDEKAKAIYDIILDYADQSLESETLTYKYTDSLRMKPVADAAIVDMMYRGVAWFITGDDKYLEKQWLDLEAVANFPDYNLATMHDSAEWNALLAFGYDWFYHGLSQERRDFLADRILNHSLPPHADGYYGRIRGRNDSGDWANLKWVSNIASVSNAGPLLAAAAVAEYDPEYCFDVISKAIKGLEHPLMYFAPNGAWNEGAGYWGYTCQYLGYSLLTLKSMFGSYYGLDDAKGFNHTDDAMVSITGPGGINNIGDANGGESTKSFLAFNMIGEIIGSSQFQDVRVTHVLGGAHAYAEDLFSYIEHDGTGDDDSNIVHHRTMTGSEFYTIRQDYSPNSEGLFFSTHFGPTSGYHTHNDTGTFVLDMFGERWAYDLGLDEYSLQNFLGYKASDLYRYRAEGHNCLVINPSTGFEQQQGKVVPLERYDSNEYGGYVTADMSEVYADADKVKVGYYIDDNMRSVTAAYEIKVNKQSDLYWFMHTDAEIIVDGNNAYLTKHGKTMMLSLETDAADAQLSVMDAVPLDSSPKAPEQNQNVGFRKVVVKLKADGDVSFRVKVAPMGEGISMKPTDAPIDSWQLPQKKELISGASHDGDIKITCDGAPLSGNKVLVYDTMPKIAVELSDSSLRAEIKEAQTADEQTVIKVYDADGNLVSVSAVSYFKAGAQDVGEANIKGVEVSAEPQPQNGKMNMIDGNFSTRWTGMQRGEYAVFDLGESLSLDKVAVAFWKQAERRYYFDLLVSDDGENYMSVYSGESAQLGSDSEYTNVNLGGVKARYVKIVGNGNSVSGPSNVNINILEFKIYQK